MPSSDASQFTRFKKANTVQRIANTARGDMKSVNHMTQYVPRLSGAYSETEFVSSPTNSITYVIIPPPPPPPAPTLQFYASTNDPFSSYGNYVTYANNTWIAVGGNPARIAYSTNGQTWTAAGGNPFIHAGFTNGICSYVAYNGNNKWVAVGRGDKSIFYSTNNGQSWTGVTTDPFGGYNTSGGEYVTYANGTWIATGFNTATDGRTIVYSTDGQTWSAITGSDPFNNPGGDENCYRAIYGRNNNWVAIGYGNNAIAYSSDNGRSWTGVTNNPFGDGYTNADVNYLAYDGNSKWVASGSGPFNLAYSSDDGHTWTGVTSDPFGPSGGCDFVTYANGTWLATGQGNTTIAYSTNGQTWTASTNNPFGTGNGKFCKSVSYNGNGTWLATGQGNTTIAYSTDNGRTWTAISGDPFGGGVPARSSAYGNGTWVALGTNSTHNTVYGLLE